MDDSVALREDSSFMENHVLDSTGFVELVAFVEEAFGIEVSDAEMLPENFDSLANVARFVTAKRLAAAAE
ncbi:MAG TPA: acyl carrier protein [Usitatibacter sp.]|nr:acyl carrier protein [Usitatibacter sp.]